MSRDACQVTNRSYGAGEGRGVDLLNPDVELVSPVEVRLVNNLTQTYFNITFGKQSHTNVLQHSTLPQH